MESANEAARRIIERYGNLALDYIEDRVSSARAESDWPALRSWREIGANVVRLQAQHSAGRDGIGAASPAALGEKPPSRILIVEDDTVVAELCRRILADEGYDCAVAHTLASARDEIAANGPNLLLADVELPGGATGRSLDADARRAGIGILFMSGDYGALRDLAHDRIPHLRKPFRLEELVARVGAVLDAVRPTMRSQMTAADLSDQNKSQERRELASTIGAYHAAMLLVQGYGADLAAVMAAKRALVLLKSGDRGGFALCVASSSRHVN